MSTMLIDCAISLHDKIACLKRELGWRELVFPRRVRAGKMTAAQAYREMEIMQAILNDYENGTLVST
jgi:hypothetical protein